MPLSQPNDLRNVRQRFGSLMMLHDRREPRTDFRPLRLTVTYHAPCQQQGHGIGKRLIAAQADRDLAGVVQDLTGVDDLIVAGSHGFDIWSPTEGTLEHEAGGGFEELIERVTERVREEADPVRGSLVEPKTASVPLHYRLVADADRPAIEAIVDRVLAAHPDELKLTPGKMVFEIQPKLEWDKGRAVSYLLEALGLDGDDVVALYLGDDITGEAAFRTLCGKGIGIFVGQADDPEIGGGGTSAAFVLDSIEEVERFLDTLAQ